MKIITLAAALSIAVAATAVAEARDYRASDIPQIEVWFGDLNLDNPRGAEAMLSRLKRAAAHVCGGLPDIRESQALYRQCTKVAIERALAKLNAPLVMSLYQRRPIQDVAFR